MERTFYLLNRKSDAFVLCIAFPLIYVGFLALPINRVLDNYLEGHVAKNISSIFKSALIIIVCAYIINRNVFNNSFYRSFHLRNLSYLLIPLAYPISLGLLNLSNLESEFLQSWVFWVYILLVFARAFAEEFAFRGFLFHYLIQKKSSKRSILKYAVLSSGLFAFMHLINIRHYSVYDVINQMIAAFCFGVFFCSLIVKLQNIYLIGLIHGLINFLFSPKNTFLNSSTEVVNGDVEQNPVTSIMVFAALFIPLLVIGSRILWKDKSYVLK